MNTFEQKLKTARRNFRTRFLIVGLGGIGLIAVILPLAYFAQIAQVVAFRIAPQPAADHAEVSVSEGVGVVISDNAYLLGERATLQFAAPGFVTQAVEVDAAQDVGLLEVVLQAAAVQVAITTTPSLPQTRWYVNGAFVAAAEQFSGEMQPQSEAEPDMVSITADHEFYQPKTLQVELQVGEDFARQLELTPVDGSIRVQSAPVGASVEFDGEIRGITPLTLGAVAGGLHRLQVALPGHETIEEEIAITNKLPDVARDYRLKLQRSTARVSVFPAGGILSVNGVPVSATAPLSLDAGTSHVVRYEKAGYLSQSREVRVPLGDSTPVEITFRLQAEIGEVVIRAEPPAELFINDQLRGTTPQTAKLQALPHKITLKRSGYRTLERMVTPNSASRILIDETLQTEFAARLAEAAPTITAAAGVAMKLFDPRAHANMPFTLGAPATDRFRRADEFQRTVKLTRPFYVSTREITEAQFARYKPIQVSGKGYPVRGVSWLEAAGFANWMSVQDGLRPAYRIVDGRLRDFDADADGYRLPSEAEWEWLARAAGRAEVVRFVWGNQTTIPANSGNFADESAKGSVPAYIPRYKDGFAGVAPVASFTPDAAGLYDMAGNVSEWVHDRYDLRRPVAGQVEIDPFGGGGGDGSRVVKGANFRSASITALRASFREGLGKQRDDVGFRVVRYLYVE